ncbi:MAG: hypothetical protein AAF449_01140 [Myxococcota bacterium]
MQEQSKTLAASIGAVLFTSPTWVWAQQANRSLNQTVASLQEQVINWILTLGWAAIAIYVAMMGLQWAMGDGRAAGNWWKPVVGAALLGSAGWFATEIRTAVGQ